MTSPEPEYIDPIDIRLGPIRHQSLPSELLELIQAIYDLIGPHLGTTLEQFEVGFMRDMHAESEVAVWCGITAAWVAYHEQHLEGKPLSDEEEKQLVGALAAISTGVEDVEKLGVPVDVGEKLLACYDGLSEEAE